MDWHPSGFLQQKPGLAPLGWATQLKCKINLLLWALFQSNFFDLIEVFWIPLFLCAAWPVGRTQSWWYMSWWPSPLLPSKFFHSGSSTCIQFQGLPIIELRWRNKQPQWSLKVLPKPLCEKTLKTIFLIPWKFFYKLLSKKRRTNELSK